MSLLKTVCTQSDSTSLSPSLIHVLQYESERRKYGRDLIDFDKKWSKLFHDKPPSQTEEKEDSVSQPEFLRCAPSAFSGLHCAWMVKSWSIRRMLETSNGFMSGIGLRYEPSIIVDPQHQSCAAKLVVGDA